ncbi:sensor histidine kinase [Spirillospora sp. CA-128828]|uniref:sensor histidine kinase n=1 Tax=Spirillospora sp. CA-128828 TaxID=3240033 RepID=UPI003D940D3F
MNEEPQVTSWKGTPKRRVPDLDLEQMDRRGPGGLVFVFWLVILVWPVWDMVQGRTHPLWLAALALALFASLHSAVVHTAFDGRYPMRLPIALLVAQTGVAVWGALVFQGRWYTLFPLVGLATGVVVGHLPRNSKGPELHMLIGIGSVSSLSALIGWASGEDGGALAANWYGTVTAGIVTAVFLRLSIVIGLLRDAREQLADAAVARERLRFSRDLHDLLGHTLSLMVVKAQAVRRIAERDPAVAAEQAADIETVGRKALEEVRQAVSGYRGRGLAEELDAARMALADNGVDVSVRRTGPPLPPQPDALLGWAVREGVTNVIRHSDAGRCEITLRSDDDGAVLEVKDDGTGKGGIGGSGGHGLRGLSERMEVVAGTVQAGPAPDGGFLLTVTIPVTAALDAGGQ